MLSHILQQRSNRGVLCQDPNMGWAPSIKAGCPRSAQCPHCFRDLLAEVEPELRRPLIGRRLPPGGMWLSRGEHG
eukprot:11012718-Prorocentrum_lima.AAC.1